MDIQFRSEFSTGTEAQKHQELIPNHVNPPEFILPERRNFSVDPLIDRTWPMAKTLGLDGNQFEAFKAALTKQFVIIQGPPGTGKTFVGKKHPYLVRTF